MPRVFICYRRDDAPASAGRLYDRLAERFGRDHVFMDVDTIRPGQDYAAQIDDFVGGCDALVAVVGRGWVGAGAEGGRRIDDPGDYVRLEIEAALARDDIQVLPVLVEGGSMPAPGDLPPSLAAFAGRQAVDVSQSRFGYDAGRLADAIEGGVAAPPAEVREVREERSGGLLRRPIVWVGAAVVVAAVAVALVLALGGGGDDEADPSASGDGPSLEAGRSVTLTAFEAWQSDELYRLEDSQISASALRALNQMPFAPVAPLPPAPGACSGTPDEVGCTYVYPGLGIYLSFVALRYPGGLRLADVRCYDDQGKELSGGISTCARIVEES